MLALFYFQGELREEIMELQLLENPIRFERNRRSRRKNPMAGLKSITANWMQGVGAMDIASAIAGMAAATLIPSKMATDTTANKWLKVGASALSAVGVGLLAKQFMGTKAGASAVLGGLAGAGAMAINTFRPSTIVITRPTASPVGRIGSQFNVSPPRMRSEETVSVIEP